MRHIIETNPGEWWESEDMRQWHRINPDEITFRNKSIEEALNQIVDYMSRQKTKDARTIKNVDSLEKLRPKRNLRPISEADITRLEIALEKIPTVKAEEDKEGE